MSKNLLRRMVRWAAEQPHPARQYYNPDLSLSEECALLRRNYLLLQTGQAALGLIGPDVLGIAVEPRHDEVILHIAAASRTEALDEDLADMTGDLDAYLSDGPEHLTRISVQVHVGTADDTWPGRAHALLFLVKPTPDQPIHRS